MTWTPERLRLMDTLLKDAESAPGTVTLYGDTWGDIAALARIGLAVVKADPETVDGMVRAYEDAYDSHRYYIPALCMDAALAARAEPPADPRPYDCRFRQKDEGRPYPKSSCVACGATVITGLGSACAQVAPAPAEPPADVAALVEEAHALQDEWADRTHISSDLAARASVIDTVTIVISGDRLHSCNRRLAAALTAQAERANAALAARVIELEAALRACVEAHETGRYELARAAYHTARTALETPNAE